MTSAAFVAAATIETIDCSFLHVIESSKQTQIFVPNSNNIILIHNLKKLEFRPTVLTRINTIIFYFFVDNFISVCILYKLTKL